ncbi:PEGA domain-containing protein [Methanoculleus caldifontis]|nr:PEGA domain-containing protein [Methanoculleus sp. Wushi-C6]
MRYKTLLICLLIFALLSAGCTNTASQPGITFSGKNTPTPTPTPGYGSVMISSDPWGADVYLDGEHKGVAPLTLTNVPAGKHTLRVKMLGYRESNSNITVITDKALTIKQSLQRGKPDIYVSIDSTKIIQQGTLIEVSGEVENRGDEAAYEFKVIIEMTPKDSSMKDLKASKTVVIGALKPGDRKHYVGHVQLKRYYDYKGTIKCEYVFDGKTHTGSTKSF